VDAAPRLAPGDLAALRRTLMASIASFGVPLIPAERETIENFHLRFVNAGLSLRFNTSGRPPQDDYPTYRDLLLEVDPAGVQRSFLASETDYAFIRQMQMEDRIVPATGDLGGIQALTAIARYLRSTGRRVAAFYTSNVEFYLFRNSTFPRFMENLKRLPFLPNAVIVRSVFPSGGGSPRQLPGYNSTSLTQRVDALLQGWANGQFRQYWELTR
jgi:hypothetical protein